MEEQPLNLRGSLQIMRRLWILLVLATALGLALGGAYAVRHPPLYSSFALVVNDTPQGATDAADASTADSTQLVIASSDTVLQRALGALPGMRLEQLRERVYVRNVTYNLLSIGASGTTPAEANGIADAVARSYVDVLASTRVPGLSVRAGVLQRAAHATRKSSVVAHLLSTSAVGGLLGFVVGTGVCLAIGRSDRRLRRRDAIAASIGVPVLASLPVSHPRNTGGWRKLLEDYQPGAVDVWRVRKSLQLLGMDAGPQAYASMHLSLEVVSFHHDKRALAVAPHLAVAAAAMGIPATLVIRPQEDPKATAALRAACARLLGSTRPRRNLQFHLDDGDESGRPAPYGLDLVVTVLDGKAPQFGAGLVSTSTVLAVSSGGATADQIANAAASAAVAGRELTGIFVADPDPSDQTTGHLPAGQASLRPVGRRMESAP